MSAVKDAGTWKPIVALHVKSGGVWKRVLAGFVKQGGVWKQFLAAFAIATGSLGTRTNTSITAGTRSVAFSLNNDGTTTAVGGSGVLSNWGTPTTAGIGSSWSVRFTVSGGAVVTSGTVGTWLSLSTGQTITLRNATTTTDNLGNISCELSSDGGTTVAATPTIAYEIGYAP